MPVKTPLGIAGAPKIAKHINKSVRQTYYLLIKGQLPGAYKLGRVWHLRPETLDREIEKLERQTAAE